MDILHLAARCRNVPVGSTLDGVDTAAVQTKLALVPEADRVPLMSRLQAYLMELGANSASPYLDLYWRERGRYLYWINASGHIGFLLVRQVAGGALEVAEFCVGEAWRRTGVGQAAASALFAAHPGPWRVQASTLKRSRELLEQGGPARGTRGGE